MKLLFALLCLLYLPALSQKNIKAFGDSNTDFWVDLPKEKKWLYLVGQEVPLAIENYAHAGTTLYGASGLEGEKGKAAFGQKDFATFLYGTNDAHKIDINEKWKTDYRQYIREFIETGYNQQQLIIISTPYHVNPDYLSANPTLLPRLEKIRIYCMEIAAELGIQFIDLYLEMKKQNRAHAYYFSDDLHLNEKGHRLLADLVKQKISNSAVSITLPVKFTLFTSKCEPDGIQLLWKTEGESNSRQFDIEHSSDGYRWNVVGSVAAAGTINKEKSYSFMASQPGQYRIVQYDFSGQKTMSSIIRAVCTVSDASFSLYPNPAVSVGNIRVLAVEDAIWVVTLFDAKGVLVKTVNLALTRGINLLPVDVGNLKPGIYTLHARWKNEFKSFKLVKQ